MTLSHLLDIEFRRGQQRAQAEHSVCFCHCHVAGYCSECSGLTGEPEAARAEYALDQEAAA